MIDSRGATPKLDRLNRIYRERAAYFLLNHTDAINFVEAIYDIAHVWDDLIDHDRTLTDEEIMTVFWLAIVALPMNPFYREHFATLHPILMNSIINWRTATAMERHGDGRSREIAFVLRATYTDVMTISVLLVGGLDWLIQVSPDIQRWIHEESYAEYLVHLQQEKEGRDGVRRG